MNEKYRYSLLKKSIIDDFELKGGWVLNSNDLTDGKKYKYGTLKYTHGNMNLILFQGFPSKFNKSFSLNDEQRYMDIFGRIVEDSYNYIHCHNATEMSLHIFDSPVKEQKLYVKFFTVSNFSPDQNLKLNTLVLDYDLLNAWIDPVQHYSYSDKKHNGLTIKSNGDKLLGIFKYKEYFYSVYLTGSVNENINRRKIVYMNNSLLRIVSNSDIDDQLAINISNNFAKMLTAILNLPVSPLLTSKNINLKFDRRREDIFYDTLYPINKVKPNPQFLFPYKKFDVDKLIYNWFNMSDELKMLVDDYLLTVVYHETIENQLINLTEGIESYYRELNISLFKELKTFVNELPLVIQNELDNYIEDMDEWLKGIKDTRVFVAHGILKPHKISNLNEIIIRVSALKLLVQCFIMDKLGFDFSAVDNRYDQVFIELRNIFNTTFL